MDDEAIEDLEGQMTVVAVLLAQLIEERAYNTEDPSVFIDALHQGVKQRILPPDGDGTTPREAGALHILGKIFQEAERLSHK